MKTNRIRNLMTAVIFSGFVTPLTGFAHEPVDPLHSIPIEMVDSRMAKPTGIHVQLMDQGVEVKGKLKRKGHKNISLRGHVDVELLNTAGQVIESEKLSISHRSGTAKHDHDRDFSIVLPLPEEKEYSVRVRHSTDNSDHVSGMKE